MKLTTEQKNLVITWLTAGLTSPEINERGAQEDPPFSCSTAQLTYYRKSRGLRASIGEPVQVVEVEPQFKDVEPEVIFTRAAAEVNAIRTGLALRGERVELLKQMAEKMAADLLEDDKFWLNVRRGAGSGKVAEVNDVKEFNKAEVDALRGVLDDIAAELGHRVNVQMTMQGPKLIWDMGPMDGSNLEDQND